MTVSHRATDASAAGPAAKAEKVVRMACCCKLSDLLPLVRQMHREVARAQAGKRQSEAA